MKLYDTTKKSKPAIVVHTGAGYEEITDSNTEKEYKQGIFEALKAGYNLLKNSKSALEAAEATCIVLENNPLFNAGVGSVLNCAGFIEMDACLMDGSTLRFGSVTNVTTVKNPISICRKLLEEDKYLFLSGKGAEEFALLNDLEIVDNKYFITKFRQKQLQKLIYKKRSDSISWNEINEADIIQNYGTVGVVCLDVFGNIAAATSTGGTNNKPVGRVGDSALVGCGTYANNETCGVSCTGKGENIIKCVNAFKVHAMMKYGNLDLTNACNNSMIEIRQLGAHAGFIALDKDGTIVTMYDTAMMGRGYVKDDKCEIYVQNKEKDLTPTSFII